MEPEILVFMPNGDVTLTLIRHVEEEIDSPTLTRASSFSSTNSRGSSTVGKASTSFGDATKPEIPEFGIPTEALEPRSREEEEPEPEESLFFFAPDPPTGDDGPLYPPAPRARRGSNASSRRDRSESPPASFWASLKRQKQAMAIPVEEVPVVVTPKPTKPLPPKKTVIRDQEVRCVVSSRHMMLASEHFQTLLSGDFEEGLTLRKTGHVIIPLSDDPDILIILLNIIHGATRKVPRQVSLELLRKLAVTVNDFGMLGSVEFFADTWIDHSKREGLPSSYTEDVLSWLFVFFVFERTEEFKDMTKLTQRECDEKFDENAREISLPITIVDSIKQGRLDAINSAITVIHTFITKYMDGETHCESGMDEDLRFACDSMLLGSLMKGSRKIGIWPRPDAPFIGQKFRDLAKAIRGIKIPDVCGRSSGRRWTSYGGFEGNAHGLEKQIEDAIVAAEARLVGLELEKYRKEGVGSWEDFRAHIPPPVATVEPEETPVVVAQETPVKDISSDEETIPVYGSPQPPSRRSSVLSQGIMARPRPSIAEADEFRQLPVEELKKVFDPQAERPSTSTSTSSSGRGDHQPTSRPSVTEDLRRSYILQGNMARLVEDEIVDQPPPVPTKNDQVKKGFFAEVKSNVLPEMVQESPTKDKFVKAPSPTPSKEKIVYASVYEPPRVVEEQKITPKASAYQLSNKREPSSPTSNFDFEIKRQKEIPEPVSERPRMPSKESSRDTIRASRESTTPSPTNVKANSKEHVKEQISKESMASHTTTHSRENHANSHNGNLNSRESITNTINFRQPQPPKEDLKELLATTTEEEGDVWVPQPQTYKNRRGNKKRFSVNRF